MIFMSIFVNIIKWNFYILLRLNILILNIEGSHFHKNI